MNIRFLYQGIDIDDRTKDYIIKRLERIGKLVDPVTEFEVEIGQDKKGKFRVEIMAKTPRDLYRAEDESVSIEGSADMAVDEMERQVTKTKDKIRDLKMRGERSIKKELVVDEDARF